MITAEDDAIELACVALANLRAVDDPRWSVRSLARAWQELGWWGRFRRAWWDIGNDRAGVDPRYGSASLLALPVMRLGPLERSQASTRFERPFRFEYLDYYPYDGGFAIEQIIVDERPVPGWRTDPERGSLRIAGRPIANRFVAIAIVNPSRWNAVVIQISIRGVTLTREVSPFDWRRDSDTDNTHFNVAQAFAPHDSPRRKGTP